MDQGDETDRPRAADTEDAAGSGANGEANASPTDRSAPIAAGLILAAVALAFVLAPRAVAWADGVRPGLGFPMAVVLFALIGGGFIGVFWLRGRARR